MDPIIRAEGAIKYGDVAKLIDTLHTAPEILHLRLKDGSSLLHRAASLGRFDFAKVLLEKSADVNARDRLGNSALHLLYRPMEVDFASSRKTLETILEHNPDINARNQSGETPLLHHLSRAPQSDYLIIMDSLLAKGADPNLSDNQGVTPLHVLCEDPNSWGYFHLIDKLVRHGADLSANDQYGKRPADYLRAPPNEEHFSDFKRLLEIVT